MASLLGIRFCFKLQASGSCERYGARRVTEAGHCLDPRGEEKAKYGMLFHVPARTCVVSFIDPEGLRHSTEVQAETLYEAAVLATQAFKEQDCAPGQASTLEVEIRRPSIVHSVPMRKVQEWLSGAYKSPNEKVVKERLKRLLAS